MSLQYTTTAFELCPTCARKVGAFALCKECLERREYHSLLDTLHTFPWWALGVKRIIHNMIKICTVCRGDSRHHPECPEHGR